MSSIGRTHHLRCQAEKCGKRRPHWSDFCKAHRDEKITREGDMPKIHDKELRGNLDEIGNLKADQAEEKVRPVPYFPGKRQDGSGNY